MTQVTIFLHVCRARLSPMIGSCLLRMQVRVLAQAAIPTHGSVRAYQQYAYHLARTTDRSWAFLLPEAFLSPNMPRSKWPWPCNYQIADRPEVLRCLSDVIVFHQDIPVC